MRKEILPAVLLSLLILLPIEVSARGSGTQADPFRIKTLVFDAYFVTRGSGYMTVAGSYVSTSNDNIAQLSDKALANGANTITIVSDWSDIDCCGCDMVEAVLRAGKDDNDIIYTDSSWSGTGGLYLYSPLWDLPWTANEKALASDTCSDYSCCMIEVSRTFYVLLVESTPPTVTVTAPPAWQNTDAPAGVSCTDNVGGSGCNPSSFRLAVYSSDLGSCPANYNSYTLSSPQTITSYAWVCAAAIDNEENIGFSPLTEFKIEKTPPTGTISVQNGALYTTSASVTLSLTYSDTGGSLVKDCRYSNDGVFDTEQWEGCTATKSWTLAPGQGQRTVYFQVRDNANNINQTSDSIFLVLNPMCSSAPNGLSCCIKSSCNSSEVDLFHMSDRGNAYAELSTQSYYPYKTCCSGIPALGTSCSGNYAVIFRLSSTTTSVVEKNTLSNYPNMACMSVNDGSIDCGYVNSPSACTTLGPNYLCMATMSSDTNAMISDCDGINDYAIKVCCQFRDSIPPTTAITPNGVALTGQDPSFALSCSDKGGTCQSTYYKIIDDGQACGTGFSLGTSGTIDCASGSVCMKRVCYYSTDGAGNAEAANMSNVFIIDKQPPVTTDNSDSNWHGSDVSITLRCQDTLAGCNRTYFCIYNEGEAPCTPLSQGNTVAVSCMATTCSRIIRYYSTDNVNNQESLRDSKTIRIDKSIPSCTLGSLPEYSSSASLQIAWNATSPPGSSPITNVTIEKNETGAWEVLSVSTQPVSSMIFTGQNGHTYNFRCYTMNAQGPGSYSIAVSTMVDTSPPTVSSINSPAFTNASAFTLSWSGSDAETGIANCNVYYKAGSGGTYTLWSNFLAATGSALFGENGQPLTPQNGISYLFRVQAFDKAGNSRNSSEISTMADFTSPTCSISSLAQYTKTTDFTVSWSGTDGESGISGYIVESRSTGPWEQFYKGPLTSQEIYDAEDGLYRFRCKAADKAGNLGIFSQEKSTTVDANPPAVNPDYKDSVFAIENMTIKATITDAVGIASVNLSYNNTQVTPLLEDNSDPSIWNLTWRISTPSLQGSYKFTIKATDAAGNNYSKDYFFNAIYCTESDNRTCGPCESGISTCINGNWTDCIGAKKISNEICNRDDDDCDGIIDNVNGKSSVLETGCGCYGGLNPQPEDCNGIDDDCDGQVDDGAACCTENETKQCSKNEGICRQGYQACSDGVFQPDCIGGIMPNPAGESCTNGMDDDCDGKADMDDEDCTTPCTDSDGDGFGYPATGCGNPQEDCNDQDANIYPGAPEVCDYIDNNCDGQADEGIQCDHCMNGAQDEDEEGTDCGGNDCAACFVWGWLFLTAGGVVILIILAVVWLHFRKYGREVTWDELKKKWTPSEFIIKKHKQYNMQYCSSSLSKGDGAKHWQLFLGVFLFALFVIPFSVQAQLSCTVTTDCSGKTDVFHMLTLSNSHAEMPTGIAYTQKVCCSGVPGLGTSCSGNYDTVLKLSSAINAHVQISSYSPSYPNSVCLSVSAGVIDCTYASSCGSGYACLATISSDTNAHVADCGAGGFGMKVCCGLLCANECSSSGQTQCSGSNSYQTCGNYDADSCLEWGSATSCGTSTCAADSCTGVTIYYDYPTLGSSTQGTCSNTCSGGSCSVCSCTASQQTCSSGLSCQLASSNCAGGTVERCHWTNSGAWQWDTSLGTETACSDGYDNDCDGKTDCQLGNEDTDCNCCNFASASITPNCGGGPCGIGDTISMSGSISGSGCSSFNFFQIDASGSGCTIAYSGGDISGISRASPSIAGSSVSGTWTISSIPSDCSSRTVSATGSGLYIGNPSSYSRAVFAGSSSGSFTFEDVLESNTVLNPYSPNPSNDNTPTYTGTASDSSSNIQAVQYRIDGGAWQNAQASDGSFNSPNEGFTFTPSAVADGTHTFETRAQDAAGNWETSYDSDSLRIDTSLPNTVLNPYAPDPTNDNTPTYTGTASDSSSNIQAVQYRIDGGAWQNAQASDGSFNSPNEGFTFTPSAVADGTHTFETRAQDAAGNWETSYDPDTLRIDTVPPDTALNPYAPDPTNDNTPTYTGTASDSSSNIQAVQYRIDGGSWQNAQPSDGAFNSPNEGFTFTPSALSDGTHTFETRAQDASGNWETTYTSDTLRIDTVPPSATVSIPPEWTSQNNFPVSWSGSDPSPSSGISGYNIQYKVAWTSGSLVRDWTDWLNPTAPGSQTFGPSSPVSLQNNQTYSFRARATDNAGNTGSYSAAAASTTFDSELPQIISNGNEDKENKVFSITSAASDGVSGIFNHTINCIVANPPPGQAPIVFVQCPPGTPFGGVSSCQITPGISYEEDTEVNCEIMAEDRAGNIYSTSIFFSGSEQIVKLSEHTVFISIGETHHGRVYVRNIKSYADNFSITITGTYPSGFARFLDSSSIIWMSLDKRNITVSLKPYEQKTIYLEITSTDVGEYTLEVSGASQKNPLLTGVDGMNIILDFPAAFPGIEVLSITAILLISGLAYFRYLRRQNQI